MSVIDTFTQRNQAFASGTFAVSGGALKIMPSLKTLIIGCVDPRVDPVELFGLQIGEAAVIRNVGGRITPDVFQTLHMLQTVAVAGGGRLGSPGWNLIVLHHTDCGIRALTKTPDDLARFLGVAPGELPGQAVNDPRASVTLDVAKLKANPAAPGGFLVTGMVYDVSTGRVETVVAPALLREP